jgi:hypothetical protein
MGLGRLESDAVSDYPHWLRFHTETQRHRENQTIMSDLGPLSVTLCPCGEFSLCSGIIETKVPVHGTIG